VVINELYVNSPDYYDRSEYIELYNATGSSIDVSGWVLSGTEYDGTCGEHHHEFPSGTTIPAGGYLVVARDVDGSDGFEARFGGLPDLEMYDSSESYESDDPRVPNTICQNPDTYDDQIRLIPGTSDYSKSCGGSYNRYEALFLFDSPSRDNLIDAVEYRYASCTSDQCTGVNTSDNDAYPRYPDEGVSLGRDDSSTDTDDCSADFYEIAPNPGAQNSLNLPPEMWSLRYSPCVPGDADDVTITCYATDSDGSVVTAKCFYNVDGAGWDSVAMSSPDSLYSGTIPAQSDGSQIEFYCRATDNLGASTVYPGDAPEGAYRYSVGMTPISVIQSVSLGDSASYVEGEAVNTTGIVTVARGTYSDNNFVIQDGIGPWSGILVYDPSYSVEADLGDSVIISGKVQEYYGMTEIYLFTDCYQEMASGLEVPSPTVVTTSAVSGASVNNIEERYEGVLVRVENVTVTDDSLGFGEWEVNDGSGGCRVDDMAYYFYTPVNGEGLDAVQGALFYSYGDYKLEPRGDGDIVGPLAMYTLRYSPHAPTASDVVTFSIEVLGDNPVSSVKLFYSTDGGANFDSTAMSSPDSVYTANAGPFTDGTIVDYYVEAWDNAGFSARKPGFGTYDFRVGMRTIYQVQSTFGGDGDSSAYAGEPVNLSGIVTAATGEYSDYYFFIQNSYTGGETPAFRGVKVYDRTGEVEVERGDSVTVSGDIWEYFNETEIAMFFPEAITIHSSGNSVPEPYSVTTASIETSEDWEGVLVSAENATVIDPDAGFGEWLISNGTAADTCRVGDDAYYTYDPLLGESLGYVNGIVMYAYKKYMLEPRDDDDICAASEAGVDGDAAGRKLMMTVRPNPVLDGARVSFNVPVSGRASIKVYNVQGELVKSLAEGRMEAGNHRIEWNGTNSRGDRITSGIYFMKLEDGRDSVVKKVVVSR
jgi:hypothetical protein